jgi:hypothetical protein
MDNLSEAFRTVTVVILFRGIIVDAEALVTVPGGCYEIRIKGDTVSFFTRLDLTARLFTFEVASLVTCSTIATKAACLVDTLSIVIPLCCTSFVAFAVTKIDLGTRAWIPLAY